MQTAVDGVEAACGRATMRPPARTRLRGGRRARGDPEAFERALHAAEAAVIDAGQVAEIQLGGASALAAPLGATEDGDRVLASSPSPAATAASRPASASCSPT